MKSKFLILNALILCLACAHAEDLPKDVVTGAVKKLAEQSNYSFTSTSRSEGNSVNWRQGPTEGKADKDGNIFCAFTYGDTDVEMAFKGKKGAIKIEGEWQGQDDLDGDRAWIGARLKANKSPTVEAMDFLDKSKDLKKADGGLYAAELTADGAKEFIKRIGRAQVDPKDPKGSVKFWIKDGLLTRYEFNLQAKVTRGDDAAELELNRTTTVEFKNLGSTKVEIPEGARKKL